MRRLVLLLAFILGCEGQGPELSDKTQPKILDGAEVFSREFTTATGLGNEAGFFNGNACIECHEGPSEGQIAGGAGNENERHEQPDNCLDPARVLHEFPVTESTTKSIGLRSSNDLFGLGRLDAIPAQEIIDYVAAEPRFLGYLNGQYWYNTPTLNINHQGVLGRFGRRAQARTLDEFVRGALVSEIGIEGSEITEAEIVALVEFVRNVQPPQRKALIKPPHIDPPEDSLQASAVPRGKGPKRPPSPPSIETGRHLFQFIGCAVCHNPATEYTDLALHNLGEMDICEGNGNTAFVSAFGSDFRTEPLTGLRLQTRFMHDGLATTLEQAIARHGMEGGFSRAGFNNLSRRDNAFRDIGQTSVILFLKSL